MLHPVRTSVIYQHTNMLISFVCIIVQIFCLVLSHFRPESTAIYFLFCSMNEHSWYHMVLTFSLQLHWVTICTKKTAASLHRLWWHIYCQNIWKQIAKATTRGDYTHDQMIVLYPINHIYTIPWHRSVISTDDQGRGCHVNTTHVPFMCQRLFTDLFLNTEK